jgi:hypothetical protein
MVQNIGIKQKMMKNDEINDFCYVFDHFLSWNQRQMNCVRRIKPKI